MTSRHAAADASAASTRRPKDRADRILKAAARLFRQRGYHATGIDDIGEAVGVSGPAVYRHYESKEALLAAAAEVAAQRTHRAFCAAIDETDDPDARLTAVVRNGITVTLDHLDMTTVYLREWRHLGKDGRRAVRDIQRRNNRIFVDAVAGVRPDVHERQARFMLQSVMGLYLSVLYYKPQVSRARLLDLMTTMTVAALRAGPVLSPDELALDQRNGSTGAGDENGSRPIVERASRREMILEAATQLFRQHGFSGVGIDEIGAAAGIAGPGVYRHFRNKEGLLIASFIRAGEQMAAGVSRAVALPTPGESLDALVASYVDVAIDSVDMIAIYLSESHALSRDERHAATRSQRWYVDEWMLVFRRVHPELPEADARVIVQAAIGLVNGYAQGVIRLPLEQVRVLLRAMVGAALDSAAATS